jgi:hypothetical protein
MLADRTTLAQFLIQARLRHPTEGGDPNSLILDVALACKAVASRVALGALRTRSCRARTRSCAPAGRSTLPCS